MSPEYKIIGKVDVNGQGMVVCKVRFELELLISSDTYLEHRKALGEAREGEANRNASNRVENIKFLDELEHEVVGVAPGIFDIGNPEIIRLINSDWVPFKNPVDLETLVLLNNAANNLHAFRVDYYPDGEDFVYTFGLVSLRVRLTESIADALIAKLTDLKNKIDQEALTLAHPTASQAGLTPLSVDKAAAIVAVGLALLAAWHGYRALKKIEEQKRKQDADPLAFAKRRTSPRNANTLGVVTWPMPGIEFSNSASLANSGCASM
jgi:hypothetical protein